jgi:hypothetical protein
MTAWKNPVSGDWSVAANWSTDTVPTSADGATLWPPAPTLSRSAARIRPLGSSSMRLRAQLIENAGSLTLIGTLQVDSGFVSLNEASTLDVNLAASVFGGMLAFGSGAALGSGTVSLFGGELLASKDETLTNALNISDTSTIDRRHAWNDTHRRRIECYNLFKFNPEHRFAREDGTILWHTNGASSVSSPATDALHVQAGTLKAVDANFSGLVGSGVQTTVNAGGTIDLAGFDATISDLFGGGAVTDSGGAATLTLDGANFQGSISGACRSALMATRRCRASRIILVARRSRAGSAGTTAARTTW